MKSGAAGGGGGGEEEDEEKHGDGISTAVGGSGDDGGGGDAITAAEEERVKKEEDDKKEKAVGAHNLDVLFDQRMMTLMEEEVDGEGALALAEKLHVSSGRKVHMLFCVLFVVENIETDVEGRWADDDELGTLPCGDQNSARRDVITLLDRLPKLFTPSDSLLASLP